jgi:hypothetical protein
MEAIMKEEITYYKIENTDIVFRTRDQGDAGYWIERRIDGELIDDSDLLKYIFNGEPGAKRISAAEAKGNPA